MISLFNINQYTIDTKNYSNLLHDDIVSKFEQTIADYVGAKYAVSFNSATSAIILCLLSNNTIVSIPSVIPPVVPNAIITSGNKIKFYDDISWVGHSYILHKFANYKLVDSAQKLEHNQFRKECDPNDLMVFSFYPTKPVGSCDGGMIVSDDYNKIQLLKELSLNGMTYAQNNWDRTIKYPGFKFYMNSIQADIAYRNFQTYEDKLIKLKRVQSIYNNELGLNNTSYHLYRLNVDENHRFLKHMKQRNIQCGIHYKTLHDHPVYKKHVIECCGNFQVSNMESSSTVSIPFHENLTDDNIIEVINGIKDYDKYSGL